MSLLGGKTLDLVNISHSVHKEIEEQQRTHEPEHIAE